MCLFPQRGVGGCSDIFIYIGSAIFFGIKILHFNIFWGFQKKYFLGYEDFVDTFWGSSQNWTSFRGRFYAFYGHFLWSRRYILGLQKFQIFLGCFIFLIF